MGMSKAVLFLTACAFVEMSSPALAGKGGGGGGGPTLSSTGKTLNMGLLGIRRE